ncbi:MAG: 2-hydroxyacyl-CoA dehydratase [Deltaproteobacteria bacterium]|nr:2-hydroxyacyl-CoA dehydratase [Deltaproteobacteria bacterium]
MSEEKSEFRKAVRSTETARSVNQILMDWYSKSLLASKEGRPVAWCMVGAPPEILKVFDLDSSWPENYGTACAARQMAVHYMQLAEGEGYSPDLCSYERNAIGYCREYLDIGGIPPDAPQGGMPWPAMLITNSTVCDPRSKGFQAFNAHYLHVPMYTMDIQMPHYGADMQDPKLKAHYLRYNIDQIWGLIRFLEEQTGTKLNEAALSEAVANSLAAQRLMWEVHELRKAVPSPMPSEDQFSCIVPMLYMAGSREAVDFFQKLHDEVRNRVENRIGVIPEEKYRILWVGIPPWFNMGIFNYLESLGAVSAMETTYYVHAPVADVDLSRPVEAIAEIGWRKASQVHTLGAELSTEGLFSPGLVLKFVREYAIDGVIFHRVLSCRAISFGQAHTARRLREELPVPVLFLESDMADPRTWSDSRIKGSISAFLDIVDTGAGKRA